MTYDDDHWREVIKTVIDRIGIERFLELVGEAVDDDIKAIVDEHMKTVEVKGEG